MRTSRALRTLGLAEVSHAPGRHGRPRHRSADRGTVTTELVLAMPLLMLLILLIAQFALWAHATHIAQAAAAEGLAAARVDGGTAAGGTGETRLVLDQLGRGPLRDPRVTVTRDGQRAAVAVSGTAISVVPFLRLRVHAEAAGPAEVFRLGADTP